MTDNVIQETINAQPTWSEAPEAPISEEIAPEVSEVPEEVEAPQEVEEAAPAPDPIEAQRLAELVRRDGENQSQIQELKNQLREFQELQSLKDSDPLALLAKLNLNPDDIVNKALGMEPEVDPVKQQLEELAKFKEEHLAEKKALQESQEKQRQEQAVQSFQSEISEVIQSNVDKYELCSLSADDAIQKAYSVIDYEYQQSGQLIDISKALDVVEDHYEKEARRLAAAKKLGYQPVKVEETQAVKEAPAQAPSTLTNKSQSIAPSKNVPFELTIEESKKKAADLLKWI